MSLTESPPNIVNRATAPLGGWIQRSTNMSARATKMAVLKHKSGASMKREQVIPTSAQIRFPPMIDQGCARGLAGRVNKMMVEAPIGASNQICPTCGVDKEMLKKAVKKIPSPAPKHALSLSLRPS